MRKSSEFVDMDCASQTGLRFKIKREMNDDPVPKIKYVKSHISDFRLGLVCKLLRKAVYIKKINRNY